MISVPFRLLIVSFVVVVVGNGCATAPDNSKPPEIVFEKTRQVLGTDHVVVYWMSLQPELIEKTTYLTLSSVSPSANARQLARFLSHAQTNTVSVAMVGADNRITRKDIIGALSLQKSQLPGLRLLFFGNVGDKDAVRAAVEQQGGQFFFEPYE